MSRCASLAAGAAALWAATLIAAVHPGAASQAATRVDFRRDVQPILEARCIECHGQDKRKGGLSLATYGDTLEGGRNGAVIRPGNGQGSLLLHRISGEVEPQMPKDDDPLTPAQVAIIRRWIDQGARATPSSAAAPQPWEAPLALTRPAVPAARWTGWSSPADRFVAAYLADRRAPQPTMVGDATFARRVYLDVWGLLPTPEQLQAFVDDPRAGKREALVAALLADGEKYADHWMSFWNDLLRNEDGVSYFSETAGRKTITDWLQTALRTNLRYDEFVRALLNPVKPGDPEGFLIGVNWRGETSAAVTPWMQASQNTAQVLLGINLKCNACHDSFISKWKLKDAYALAAYFSPEPKLQLYRCDVAQNGFAEPAFLLPDVGHRPASTSLADRRAAAAASFTDPRNGRLPRTFVNRIWQRLLGHGLVANADEMDGRPWSPELLDYLASDFVAQGHDVKRLIGTILTSRAYQMPSVPRRDDLPARSYTFAGPEVRRLTGEQFADAIGAMTGEWNVYPARRPAAPGAAVKREGPPPSLPPTEGAYAREWRAASSTFTRALGRPIRDQIISARHAPPTIPQALELVNGEMLTRWLSRGARRMLGELPADTLSLYNRSVSGRYASSTAFDIDIAKSDTLWLIVHESGSNAPELVQPIWGEPQLVDASGAVTMLAGIKPVEASGFRAASGPANAAEAGGSLRVTNPSVLVYDISGKGFTRLRGSIGLENAKSDIGSTLNPSIRFFVFDAEPSRDRLLPPAPDLPLPAPPVLTEPAQIAERLFRHALGRPPSADERRLAEAALRDPARPGRASAQGLADLLWALVMKPEFQFVY